MKNKFIFFVILFFCLSWAGIKEDFFHTGLGAKTMAMGGTAFGFGVDSIYSNPAGLAVIPEEYYSYSYKTSYENMIDTMTFQYMKPYLRGAWGIGLIHMNNGNADKTEINEFDRPEVVGKFGERQIGISGAYAIPIWGDSAVGIGARYYNNQMDGEQGQALGFFAGYVKKLSYDWLYGLSINNFSISSRMKSTPIIWSTGHTDYFPMRISNSLAHRRYLFGKQTEFFLDLHTQEVNENGTMSTFYSLGSMVWIVPKIFNCRLGFNGETISVGLGSRFADSWGVDYAYLSHKYLGGSHFISLSYKPGNEKNEINNQQYENYIIEESTTKLIEETSSKNIEQIIKEEILVTQNIVTSMNINATENVGEKQNNEKN